MKKTKNSEVPVPIKKDGVYYNLQDTPQLSEDGSFAKIIKAQFAKPDTVKPSKPIPHKVTDLKGLYTDAPAFVWFGHSSYLLTCKGYTLLMDPVFSGSASPFSFMIKAYEGADVYKVADMPAINLHLQSHNHYDHLDKKTIKALKSQTDKYIVPGGVLQDLTSFGVSADKITEMEWGDVLEVNEDIKLTATPARHFAGRGLKRNTSLWNSYVLEFFGLKIFVGGDSGYGEHIKQIGKIFGPFDVAILECGQYHEYWPYIHTQPEETIQVALELQTEVLIPVHWAKFTLALHPWNESVERLLKASENTAVKIITPHIGEVVKLGVDFPTKKWWDDI